jgi:putative transposase
VYGGSPTPRKPRHVVTGCAHHVINRGNERRRLFFQQSDYDRFLHLLTVGKSRFRVKVFGVNVMPNHFHGLIQPDSEGALSGYLQWVLGSYASDLRARTGTVGYGHVFQRRFWSDPIKDELHFVTVLRYVEANPLRAGLVPRAEAWPWSSAVLRTELSPLLDPLPCPLPGDWIDLVNEHQSSEELAPIRWPNPRGRAGAGDCHRR